MHITNRNVCALIRLRAGLKRHFGPGAAVFVDPFLWLIGHVSIDIIRLDYWLQKQNPDYENGSMCEFIRNKYGQDAERFVGYWLKGEDLINNPTERTGHESFYNGPDADQRH